MADDEPYLRQDEEMTKLVELEDEASQDNDEPEMGSLYHGIAQANLSASRPESKIYLGRAKLKLRVLVFEKL